MNYKHLLIVFGILAFIGTSFAAAPTVLIIQPDGNQYINSSYTIDFNITDSDANSNLDANLFAHIYYSSTQGGFTTSIIDLNLMDTTVCGDQNFASTNNCTYSWDTTGITDGNYFIDINVIDKYLTNTVRDSAEDYSHTSFYIDNTSPSVTITSPAANSDVYGGTVQLQYTGTEAGVGIGTYWLKVDSGAWINNSTNTSYSFIGQADGWHTYYIIANDNLDQNSSTTSIDLMLRTASTGGTTISGCIFSNGTICNENETCKDSDWQEATDTERCCSSECIALETTQEQTTQEETTQDTSETNTDTQETIQEDIQDNTTQDNSTNTQETTQDNSTNTQDNSQTNTSQDTTNTLPEQETQSDSSPLIPVIGAIIVLGILYFVFKEQILSLISSR